MEGTLSLIMTVAQTHGSCLVSDGDSKNTCSKICEWLSERTCSLWKKSIWLVGKNTKQIPERRKKNEESMKVHLLNIFYANSNMQSSVKDLQ